MTLQNIAKKKKSKKRREEKLTNETVGGRASLGVGGAISDHDNPLVAMCLLKPSDDQTLAAGAWRRLVLVEACVFAWGQEKRLS